MSKDAILEIRKLNLEIEMLLNKISRLKSLITKYEDIFKNAKIDIQKKEIKQPTLNLFELPRTLTVITIPQSTIAYYDEE